MNSVIRENPVPTPSKRFHAIRSHVQAISVLWKSLLKSLKYRRPNRLDFLLYSSCVYAQAKSISTASAFNFSNYLESRGLTSSINLRYSPVVASKDELFTIKALLQLARRNKNNNGRRISSNGTYGDSITADSAFCALYILMNFMSIFSQSQS